MHYVVSVPLDPTIAEFLGKKGSENSITFYNRKLEKDTIVALAPTWLENKFYSVAETMMMAGQIIVSTANIDKLFGEVLVGCALLGKPVIFTNDSDVSKFINDAKLGNYKISDRTSLVDAILSNRGDMDSPTGNASNNNLRIDLDKSFPVKGIGTVALGIVTSGHVNVHDTLYHSSGKQVLVRSIQVHDQDLQEAGAGARVGLALKDIESGEIEKGDLLLKGKFGKTTNINAKISKTMGKEKIEVGKGYELVSNFTFSKARVEKITGDTISLKLERPTSVLNGDKILLLRDESPRIFAFGEVESVL
ncbi:MAG: EF-Tu/IF-2/RF-3 family GTPase [Candidatus Marsarchaeota archaeon]|nr:EF-Tu/IF-2/RF-3 family GTPase [Candidatus Marsarchaeota archaeon]